MTRRRPAPSASTCSFPARPAADAAALASYLERIAADAGQAGAEPGDPSWDDDDWPAKIADLIARPVPIVSFTFGCPEPDLVAALRAAGSSVWVTVTDPHEAAAGGRGRRRLPVRAGRGGGSAPRHLHEPARLPGSATARRGRLGRST